MSPSEKNTMKDHVNVEGHDGAFAAYIARPKTSPTPAVVERSGFSMAAPR